MSIFWYIIVPNIILGAAMVSFRSKSLLNKLKEAQSEISTLKKEVQMNKAYFNSLIKDQFDLICRFLPDFTITFVNDIFTDYLETARVNVIAKSIFEFIPEDFHSEIISKLNSLNQDYPVVHQEVLMVTKNKNCWIKWTIRAIFNDNGKKIEYQAVGQDISELKHSVNLIKLNQKKYYSLFNNINEGFVVMEIIYDKENNPYDCQHLEFNSAFQNLTGYTREKLLQKSLKELLGKAYPSEELDHRINIYADVVRTGESTRFQRKNRFGDKYYEEFAFYFGKDQCAVIIIDATEKKLAEERMRQTQDDLEKKVKERTAQLNSANVFLQQLIDAIPIPVYYKNPQGVYLWFNKAWEDSIGLPRGKMLGCTVYDLFPKHLADIHYNIDNELINTRGLKVYEGTIITANGFERNVVFNKTTFLDANGIPEGLIGVYTDITDHKKTEKALRESEQRISDIINSLPDAVVVIDKAGKVIYWNTAAEDMTGVKAQDILGKDNFEYGLAIYGIRRPILVDLLLNDNKKYRESYDNFERKGSILFGENFCPGINESGAYLRGAASPLYDTRGNLVGAIESFRDITDRKNYEDALQVSEKMYRQIVETANEGIWIIDAQNITTFVNKKMAEMLGYTVEEMIGKSLFNFMDERTIPKAKTNISKRSKVINDKYDTKYVHKDGHYIYTINSGRVMFDKNGNYTGTLGMVTDITERKKIEKQMARLDRLNLIGEIAAGIAHEIRNPMTSVRGFLQMLQSKDEYSKDWEFFNIMIEELDRANYIITEFLSLGTNKMVKLRSSNLNKIINAMLPLIKAEAISQDKNISLQFSEVPDLLLDEREIRQLILNLVNNGLEAMSPGKKLTIYTFLENSGVVLAIHDQGCGIDPKILDKMGTSFHTTKENGTGLGIPMCYSIAARHNAIIEIDTSSYGTTVFVRFKIPEKI